MTQGTQGSGSTHRLSTACMEMNRAGTLKVSKNTSAAFSRFLLGLSGASVRRTGCCERRQRCAQAQRPCARPERIFPGLPHPPPVHEHRKLRPAIPLEGTSLSSASSYSPKDPGLPGTLCLAATDHVDPHPHNKEGEGPERQRALTEARGNMEA